VETSAFEDIFVNSNVGDAIHQTATAVVRDQRSPLVLSTVLNMSSGTIMLSFNEPVVVATVNVSSLALQATSGATADTVSIAGAVLTAQATALTVTIQLAEPLLIELKFHHKIATSQATAYVACDASFVEDTFGNKIAPVSLSAAVQVSTFIADLVRPQLASFAVQSTGTATSYVVKLSLTFSEPVNTTSFVPQSVTLQSAASNAQTHRSLSGADSVVSSNYGQVVTVSVTAADLQGFREIDAFIRTLPLPTSHFRVVQFRIWLATTWSQCSECKL